MKRSGGKGRTYEYMDCVDLAKKKNNKEEQEEQTTTTLTKQS